MKTKVKNVYYCDHCGKKGMVKRIIEFHEQYCVKNLATYPNCFYSPHRINGEECRNLEYVATTIPSRQREQEFMMWARCKATGQWMHTTALLGAHETHKSNPDAEIEQMLKRSKLMPAKSDCKDYEG